MASNEFPKGKRSKAMSAGPTRGISRGENKEGISALKKAKHLRAKKKLGRPYNPFPEYSVLRSFDDTQIETIIKDSGVVIRGNEVVIEELI